MLYTGDATEQPCEIFFFDDDEDYPVHLPDITVKKSQVLSSVVGYFFFEKYVPIFYVILWLNNLSNVIAVRSRPLKHK
jgi:hypothetical protein